MLRKREALFLPALLLAIAFSVTGCGSSEDTTTASQEETTQEETVQEEVAEEPQIPDLTGQWEQVNKSQEGDAAYHTAVITDDTITIDWIMDDTTFLYWAGTFTAPQTADEPYTWDSENDKEKTGSALLASGDDIKAFTYENNQISYEASAMGETMTVYLEKTADLEPAQQEEVAQAEPAELEAPYFQDNVFETEEFKIEITDWRVIPVGEEGNQYGDGPVIAFWYNTTNLSDEPIDPSTTWIFHFTAIQDNDPNMINELDIASLPDPQYRDTQMADIKPGGTVPMAEAYELSDEVTPVTLQAKANMFDSEPTGEMTFDIAAQG